MQPTMAFVLCASVTLGGTKPKDNSPAVLQLVAELGKKQTVAALRRIIIALDEIGKPARRALPQLSDIVRRNASSELRNYALWAYCRIGKPNQDRVALCIKALSDSSPGVRGLAAYYLGRVGRAATPAVPALLRLLKDKAYRPRPISNHSITQRAVRYDAAEALGLIGAEEKRATIALTRVMYADKDPAVCVAAAIALFRLDEHNCLAMNSLIGSLQRNPRGTAGPEQAAWSLYELGPKAVFAIDGLKEALNHRETWVRVSVCNALGAIGHQDAASVLARALHDKDGQVRESAVEALGELGRLSAGLVPKLIQLLGIEDEDNDALFLQTKTIEALVKIGKQLGPQDAHLVKELAKLAREARTPKRVASLRVLGRIGGKRAVAVLKWALKDAVVEVQAAAIESLSRLDALSMPESPHLILAMRHDQSPPLRRAAAKAMARLGRKLGAKSGPLFRSLRRMLKDETAFVRIAAVRAISGFGGKRAASALANALDDKDLQVLYLVTESLGKLGKAASPAVPQLVRMLVAQQTNADEILLNFRRVAVRALGDIGPPAKAALPQLRHFEKSAADKALREIARKAIQRIESPQR